MAPNLHLIRTHVRRGITPFLALALACPANAGDILRGGATFRPSGRTGGSDAGAGGAVAAQTQSNSRDRLARTSQAMDAMRALQNAARNAAIARRGGLLSGLNPARPSTPLPGVPDGLGKGGLQLADGVPKNLRRPQAGENPGLWIGADLPVQSGGGGERTQVTIVQNEQQALLNWKTFNVGKNTTLTFDQSAGGRDSGKWIAFNKINDPSGRPSQILGSIQADGQVYVLNQNGIIFGGASQVNVHALVASALPINDGLVARGLLNNPQAEFLFSAVRQDALDPELPTQSLAQIVDRRSALRLEFTQKDDTVVTLVSGEDFTTEVDKNRVTSVELTPAGRAKFTNLKEGTFRARYTALGGNVQVDAGATLSAPTSPQKVGGRIALFGADVTNNGAIFTPDGQAILAAGLQVGLLPHLTEDPTLRGLDVIVGAVKDPNSRHPGHAGAAVNGGLIDSPRGNITMTGKSVQQNGVIDSTTSVSRNGRIDLLANYGAITNPAYDPTQPALGPQFLYQSTGLVTLGEGSVTRILPEWASDEEFADTTLPLRSQVNAQGLAAHFDRDSLVWAPNAEVGVHVGRWTQLLDGANDNRQTFGQSTGQIYVDRGAAIDVAGSTAVSVPLADNILDLELRGAELADSPLQRDGVLRAVTITIDAREVGEFNGREWIGTPLGDARGFIGLIQRNVGQLTTQGGSVDLSAGSSVVLSPGSRIDVSGGWSRNEGGLVQTTKLTQGSRLVPIAEATPDQLYDGVYDPKFTSVHAKWGIASTFRHALALTGEYDQAAYVQGAAGGSISIVAPAMTLDGQLTGATVNGPRQLRETATTSRAAARSTLALRFTAQNPAPLYGEPFSPETAFSPTPPRIVFSPDETQRPAAAFALDANGRALDDATADDPFALRADRARRLVLSPDLLTTAGFGHLSIDDGEGDIVVPASVTLAVAPKGSITLDARNIDVQGRVTAPGGSLSFTANNLSPYLAAELNSLAPDDRGAVELPFADPAAGRFTLGPTASLSTAGFVVDDRPTSVDARSKPIVLEGGAVDITAYTASLAAGSVVDVSGGLLLDARSAATFGNGGGISIRAGRDANFASLLPRASKDKPKNPGTFFGGRLNLDGELLGYSAARGGQLALQAPFVQVGGEASAPGTLLLQPEFFNQGGFTKFALQGIGGSVETPNGSKYLPAIVIAADTVLAPRARSLFLDPLGGDSGELSLARTLQPRGERSPVSLGFTAQSVKSYRDGALLSRGDIVMQSGAVIDVDPEAGVSFTGDTVAMLGSVFAPAGAISLVGGIDSRTIFNLDVETERPLATVFIGSRSVLSATGATLREPDPYGRRIGRVLPGGSISVAGNIVAAPGARLDVSGARGILDLSPFQADATASRVVSARSGLNAPLQSLQTVRAAVETDAGTISLVGGQELFTSADLVGRAGGASARNGTLLISSSSFIPAEQAATANVLDQKLIVRQTGLDFAASLSADGSAIGRGVRDEDGQLVRGKGYFAVEDFARGGFDSLELNAVGGTVAFEGPVNIAARGSLKVAIAGLVSATDDVLLAASYVALGKPFIPPLLPTQAPPPLDDSANPINPVPTFGSGSLTVEADLIDIGPLSLQNIGRAAFIARGGDIRGSGTLDIAGRLRLESGQIYTPSAERFTVVAYDYASPDAAPGDKSHPGSIRILASGSRQLPLSAGGTLSFYATNIDQSGVLRAPMGTINLGWDGTGPKPVDVITGDKLPFPITRRLVLGPRSITSVSAVDPLTGEGALIPYGVSLDGNSWIDPAGTDITASGLPTKNVNLAGLRVSTDASSQVDLRGGGDLYAYRWIKGNGGTQDVLAPDTSFAVIPGYQADYAPYAPFNGTADAKNLRADPSEETSNLPGYVNASLAIGDRVYLAASRDLAAGVYTLLPARYALLPGAVLVTPQAAAPIGTLAQPDGSTIVSGYRFNDLGPRPAPSVFTRFEVAPSSVVRSRSEYADFSANEFIAQKAVESGRRVPVLPSDSGHLVFQGTRSLDLLGRVLGLSTVGGRGAFIDVSSPADIVIAGPGFASAKGTIVLDAGLLSGWDAESLLVGGVRRVTDDGTTIAVQTGNLTLENAGRPLIGPEVILVARENLTLSRNSVLAQSGSLHGPGENLTVDGDGALVRLTSDPDAAFRRTNVTAGGGAKLTVEAGALFRGVALTLDSSQAMDLAPNTRFENDSVSLDAGRISVRLDPSVAIPATAGLVLEGSALRALRSVDSLSLLSYSSLDIYGAGAFRTGGSLSLHAGEIRGFGAGSGTATFAADSILLDNRAGAVATGGANPATGALRFDARTITLGRGRLAIDQFDRVELDASQRLVLADDGRLTAQNDLVTRTAVITAAPSATHTIRAGGDLRILPSADGAGAAVQSGLGASLTLLGASVTVDSDIVLPSGQLTLRASQGDVTVGGRLDVDGTRQRFNDLIKLTDAGSISLVATRGDIDLLRGGRLSLSANPAGGNAGTLSIQAPHGEISLLGQFEAAAGRGGDGGSFDLEIERLPSFAKLNDKLDAGSFDESRSFRVRQGDVVVLGVTTSHLFSLSTDAGSIRVAGTIDASGETGGTISLAAAGDLTLLDGARLDASGRIFSDAGKGGDVTLEAGAPIDGQSDPTAQLDVRDGSTIDLSVDAARPTSENYGRFTGTLHLRAPQNAAGDDVQMAAIDGTIRNASNIVVEGFRLYDLAASGGLIDAAIKDLVKADGIAFAGAAGTTTAGYAAMFERLFGGNRSAQSIASIRPGAELFDSAGDITLGTGESSPVTNDWDLASYRFGPRGAPGVLTLRASGNLVFFNALQDGFQIDDPAESYTAELLAPNPLLPANAQSWSYRLIAGADLGAADFHRVQALSHLGVDAGSLLLGKNGTNPVSGNAGQTSAAIGRGTRNRYQVIRTGSGDIDIAAGRDVKLLNAFATIYTAGTRLADPTMGGTFDLPNIDLAGGNGGPGLGNSQQANPPEVQYSLGGGDVRIAAGNDIGHYTLSDDGVLVADSERQLPNNWLYRRGEVDPLTGRFGTGGPKIDPLAPLDAQSTSWWVDFTNFFEGIGALGGGDVTLLAGRDVANVDAVAPTNARLPKGRPDAAKLIELGGGDVTVRAGRNIDGGTYYVERGQGTLAAGGEIKTNATRSFPAEIDAVTTSLNWLPTTLFLGKGRFDVSARGDVLLGPVANPFLLPTSLNNGPLYKTYFSTYAPTSSVDALSLGGDVTLRTGVSLDPEALGGTVVPLLQAWLEKQFVLSSPGAAASTQPWLRISESGVQAFGTAAALLPPVVRATAFAGDIDLVGGLTLSPASRGTLELAAAGSLNGLQPNGSGTVNGAALTTWGTSVINVSDASPDAVPGIASPFAYQNVVGPIISRARASSPDFLSFIDAAFAESGATNQTFENKQALHGAGPLHAGDASPLRLYADTGDISGLTLYSPKAARVIAGQDIADVGLYLQNVDSRDISIVAAGRDILPSKADSALRTAATTPGNVLNFTDGLNELSGDVQVAGPGAVEVLAGRNLDLGTGLDPDDGSGTRAGLTTIGNARNPNLGFDGASIVAAAGVGPAAGLASSRLDFDAFIAEDLTGAKAESYLAEIDPSLTVAAFRALPAEQRDRVALEAFYLVLRDAARDKDADGGADYASGFAAIDTLFPASAGKGIVRGDITTRSRSIRTRNGGSISLFAPRGELTLAGSTIGNPSTPPGIITEGGGNISIFTDGDVDLGVGRIFTLKGGNMIIWSSTGDIAAGVASKTLKSAPPTRALYDPQSADVETDLAGLSTGGGIGVLATVAGVEPGDVDLIAPVGVVDAGDAGIRVSGNLNIAATAVLNASNIAVSGTSTGVPTAPVVAAPNIAGLTSASTANGATSSAANDLASQARPSADSEETPSTITVEVLGYGGGEDSASL